MQIVKNYISLDKKENPWKSWNPWNQHGRYTFYKVVMDKRGFYCLTH